MPGIGTIVNVLAVVIGGTIGLFLKNGLKQRFQDIIMQVLGVCVIFIGISGALTGLLKISPEGVISTTGTAVLIGSLVVGALIGEWINIEHWLERFGEWLKIKAKSGGDSRFVEGFVTSSLVICVGAMAIVGAIEDGLNGNPSMLYTKAILDAVIVMIFASTYGKGVIFSAIPVGILQGAVTVLAQFIQPYLGPEVISGLSFIGSVLIFCVGANLCLDRKFKVANMLPALIVAGVMITFM